MSKFKKITLSFLVLLSVAALALRFSNTLTTSIFNVKEKAGIRVLSVPQGAQVFINDVDAGKTPYEDQELTTEEYSVKIQVDNNTWQGKIKLLPGTLTVINRELTNDSSSSAGEVLTLEKGSGVTIVSNPTDAIIEIDGKEYGRTPKSIDISIGEHTFAIKKGNYLNRSIRATVPENYNLVLNVDLALSEADLTNISTPPITETPKVIIKNTPTGFLRIREKPSITSKEIGKVLPGDELVLVEEMEGWDKIRMSSGIEGYVSSTYVGKK